MSLFITSLNSGSNGNCYYIGNSNEAILVDAGISCGEVEKRLKRLGLCCSKIKAIFISHEHTDHISGVRVLSKKYKLPVYITNATLSNGRLKLDSQLVHSFSSSEPITIGGLNITAFPKFHDAADPYSFVVDCDDIRIGVFTDIGKPCDQLIRHFKLCHAAFLESNYDEEMLRNGSYPHFLKSRITGGRGHLSNSQALQLFIAHRPAHMSHLVLSHLSKNNNCPVLVEKLFSDHAAGVKMIVAGRYQETELFEVTAGKKLYAEKAAVTFSQLQFAF